MIKVGVLGAGGRMGTATCSAVGADSELELVARVGRDDDLNALVTSGAEVAVDFTLPDVVKDNVRFCVENGIHVVVGATGLSDDDLDEIRGWTADGTNVFVAPNFAVGAVLMMRFAAEAAPFFGSAEIVERHGPHKKDSPSGTALRTAALMNESRGKRWDEAPDAETLPGSRGGDASGVRVHSLRVPGSVAHQEVIFGGTGETFTIRHDSLDRSSFMPGVVLAVKRVGSLDGVTVGLEHLLGL
jgi:4-hydroxy-tetrahydrodipicolinate reductase